MVIVVTHLEMKIDIPDGEILVPGNDLALILMGYLCSLNEDFKQDIARYHSFSPFGILF